MEPSSALEPTKTNKLPLIILSILLVFSLGISGFLYYQTITLKKQVATLTSTTLEKEVITTSPSLTPKPSPLPTEIIQEVSQTQTFKTPATWKEYTDEAAGITVKYPPELTAKYNPNRGAAFQYMAGSYLVGSDGSRLMDFYFYGYNGGSRRQAFYDAVQFDGPENAATFTQSATDVSLNGKTYLKITTTYTNETEPRIFYLIPQGDRLYYFTYSKAVEKNSALAKTLQTIIATSTLNSSTQSFQSNDEWNQQVWCSATEDFLKEKGDTWDARIDSSGDMVVIQRLNRVLASQVIQKEYTQITANTQTLDTPSWEINNYAIMIDSDQKGMYQDAIVLTLPKSEVAKIVAATPTTIPSVSVMMKINQSFVTLSGETCRPFGAPGAYFTNKP